jgi:hypothetical protein
LRDRYYVLAVSATLKFITSTHQPPFSSPSGNAKEAAGATWKPGAPVFVVVMMTNNTRQVFHFSFANLGADYQFSVNEKGWPTRFGEEYLELKREPEGASGASQSEDTLNPNDTHRTTIEIGSILPLDRPGKYRVEMQMNLPAELGKGLVRSNTNTITITVSE